VDGGNALDIRRVHVLNGISLAEISDRIRGQRIGIRCESTADVWTRPVETASQSEGGLERVFQALGLVAVWPVTLKEGGSTRLSVTVGTAPEE
jgi:hypothetical protein